MSLWSCPKHGLTGPMSCCQASALVHVNVPMTREQRFEQKVSFVYGVMDAGSGITKEQVRAILIAADGEGVKP